MFLEITGNTSAGMFCQLRRNCSAVGYSAYAQARFMIGIVRHLGIDMESNFCSRLDYYLPAFPPKMIVSPAWGFVHYPPAETIALRRGGPWKGFTARPA
jgi:hypothetical protein